MCLSHSRDMSFTSNYIFSRQIYKLPVANVVSQVVFSRTWIHIYMYSGSHKFPTDLRHQECLFRLFYSYFIVSPSSWLKKLVGQRMIRGSKNRQSPLGVSWTALRVIGFLNLDKAQLESKRNYTFSLLIQSFMVETLIFPYFMNYYLLP